MGLQSQTRLSVFHFHFSLCFPPTNTEHVTYLYSRMLDISWWWFAYLNMRIFFFWLLEGSVQIMLTVKFGFYLKWRCFSFSCHPNWGRCWGEDYKDTLEHEFWFIWCVFRASLVAQLVKNLPSVWETWVQSLAWEDPLEKRKATHSNILAWRIPWIV